MVKKKKLKKKIRFTLFFFQKEEKTFKIFKIAEVRFLKESTGSWKSVMDGKLLCMKEMDEWGGRSQNLHGKYVAATTHNRFKYICRPIYW